MYMYSMRPLLCADTVYSICKFINFFFLSTKYSTTKNYDLLQMKIIILYNNTEKQNIVAFF